MAYEIEPQWLERMNLRRSAADANVGPYEIVIPSRTNMAADTVGRYANEVPDRPALIFEEADHSTRTWTFADLDRDAQALAATLSDMGVGRGDRVAIHTGLRPETGITHLAVYKLGAIAVTLSQLYGPDTLAHILNHAEAKVVVTQDTAWRQFRGSVGDAVTVIPADRPRPALLNHHR